MNLVERVKNILLQPKSEWPVIEREPGDAGYLFTNYVCIVSAIPPVCSFIGMSLIGFGPFRVGIVSGLVHAIVVYVLGSGRHFRDGLHHRLPCRRLRRAEEPR